MYFYKLNLSLSKGEPIQVKECGAKQEVCPPPPRIYHDDRETSEEAKKKEKIEQTKYPSNNAIYTQEGMFLRLSYKVVIRFSLT